MDVGLLLEDLPSELLEALEGLIFAAVGLTTVAIADAAPGDLTLQQWRALVVVGRGRGVVGRGNSVPVGVRVGELAARIGISLPSASRLVARLEERGYVATARDERDHRGTIVTLTHAGARVREAVIARRRYLVTAALGADGPSLSPELGQGLATLARALERYS